VELDLLIRDGMICRHDASPARGSLGVRDGRIVVIAASAVGLDATAVIDAGERLVMPGMIDPHVHVGHGAPHASEFWTEGSSAVVGGVTTLLTYYRRHPFNYLDLVPELIAAGETNSPIDFSIHLRRRPASRPRAARETPRPPSESDRTPPARSGVCRS
jgi:dihydropyrimidinase